MDTKHITADLIFDAKAQLGEGAIWNHMESKLYWVDIEGRLFNVFDPVTNQNRTYNTLKRIGTVVPTNNGQVLVALEDGIATIELTDGTITYKIDTDIHLMHNKRFNDGKCDHEGRFWVGTHSMSGVREVSELYCISENFAMEEKVSGVSISNGIAWNADGSLMYYIDTPTGQVVQYDFDRQTGAIANKKVIITIPEEQGYPDGMTIDNEGMLWIALWDGFCVARFDPQTGEMIHKVAVPAPKVSSCAFGGDNLDTLYITTARAEMTEEELELYPLSGGVFAVKTDAKGMPAHYFK
ncbi:Sugar lactone lactonase YvrE [Mucilaginibacter mallensis]|uniref:Sugar lactone lactonase YvrE n=1 Tax=Mucilaginibacter mallensis TaxID=652787 RepID=A0A1H2AL68_MUCMA|nr:SMP-30/gluconolactonase/LRE family protein [Mucilaginibacter mallensis]SDT46502.1 Sugar lactone lactonase YvrE [Mucilaginibacter mallensis]